jgi:hypothetical protein
MPFG